MKIIVKPEAFINCPAPSLTKGMMDWFYSKLFYVVKKRFEVDKVDNINVRINQSFKDAYGYHFYMIQRKTHSSPLAWVGSSPYNLIWN